ncbi:MAG: M23 family metallopeptidase [Alphaproteobacteria bacterium]|nr:M23 family metallopeptidase [Alphaproteobacteria bacterium]
MKSFSALFILVFLLWAAPARADFLAFPLLCEAGSNCFIIGYPDMDEAPDAAKDYACGPATTEGDPFLRIGLSSVAAITLGIGVVAAEDGTVTDAKDGVEDLVVADKSQLKKGTSNCGNGVVIDHGNGFRTAYCHMRKDSIRVQKGEAVHKGQIIGYAGQSGVALWPQLGFSIRKKGYTIDPITNKSPVEGCGFKPRAYMALPEAFREYQPAAIVNIGFADAPQTAMPVAVGKALRLSRIHPSSTNITLWGMIVGAKAGDEINAKMRDPKGRVFQSQDVVLDKDKPRQLININRPRGYAYWSEGLYSGEITLTRTIDGRPYTVRRAVSVEVGATD